MILCALGNVKQIAFRAVNVQMKALCADIGTALDGKHQSCTVRTAARITMMLFFLLRIMLPLAMEKAETLRLLFFPFLTGIFVSLKVSASMGETFPAILAGLSALSRTVPKLKNAAIRQITSMALGLTPSKRLPTKFSPALI